MGVRPSMTRNWYEYPQWWLDSKVRELKMPIFEGVDAHEWLYLVLCYFTLNDFLDKERLAAAGVWLEGKALTWFQGRERWQPLGSWGEFKDQRLVWFRATQTGDIYEKLVVMLINRGATHNFVFAFVVN